MPDLFDDAASGWRIYPQKAFEAFVVSPEFLAMSKRLPKNKNGDEHENPGKPIRKSSALVYIAMWARFLRWLPLGKTVFDIGHDELMSFLEHREQGKRVLQGLTIRRQYLTLFERVYSHLKVNPNPAVHAGFAVFKNRSALVGANAPKAKLSDADQIAFMRALPTAEATEPNDHTHGWKRRRDRAMQALMLGAGLKVSEAVGLYTNNVGNTDSTGSVPISVSPASVGGTVRPHQTQLRPFAVPEVMAWLRERRALRIPGELLFPATLQGGRLDKATVYRQVKATFARAGIEVSRQGGRTLRNSFAVRELKAGGSIELVGEFMGHRRRRSTEHYNLTDEKQAPLNDTLARDVFVSACQ
jgi:integrase/recombinase XerD